MWNNGMWSKEVYVALVMLYVFDSFYVKKMEEQVKTMYESYLRMEKEEDHEV